MNRGFLQSVGIVVCAVGTVYMIYVLHQDGTLGMMWSALTSGAFGGFPM